MFTMAFVTDGDGVGSMSITTVASVCAVLVVFFGIFSWLRKRLSIDWWRSRCGCEEEESHSFSSANNSKDSKNSITVQPTHIPPSITVQPTHIPPVYVNEFDDLRKNNKNSGRANQAFEQEHYKASLYISGNQDVLSTKTNVHGLSTKSTLPNSNLLQARKGWNSVLVPEFQDSFRSRTTSNTGDYRPIAKVVSKPSITSGYDTDTESYDYPPKRYAMRKATRVRQSGKNVEKRRHKRRPHSRISTNKGHERFRRYAPSSLTNLDPHHPRAPITRRHSYDVTARGIVRQQSAVTKPTPPPRTKRKRSSSDAHLFAGFKQTATMFDDSKHASFRHDKTNRSKGASTTCSNTAQLELQQQSIIEQQAKSSENLPPTKTSTLVRSGTIMEVPIYARKERIGQSSKRFSSSGQTSVTKKTRHKPPRSHIKKEKRHPKAEKWLYGYGSLPADLSKVQSGMLEQMGLTAESFVGSIEKLDFDTLCRPVPHITDDQRLTSPRKPVVDKHMPGHEQELLKDTYRLEEFNIVATDL